MDRETSIVTAFVELSDIHVQDFAIDDYADLLVRHSIGLLGADAASLLLIAEDHRLYEYGATAAEVRDLQLHQVRRDAGPSVESFRSGRPVGSPDVHSDPRWAELSGTLANTGFAAIHAIPLRIHDDVIGSITLFRLRTGALTEDELVLAEALAHVATSCLLLRRTLTTHDVLGKQLQKALSSRVAIEQAKGILAERRGITLVGAFELMRAFARRDRILLDKVAHAVIDGSPQVSELTFPRAQAPERSDRHGPAR
jgi:GAF domain-containing protein